MSRLGHEQLDVRISDVASQVLAASRVVEPDDARADETGSPDCDDIVRGVVEKHRHVRRPVGAQPGAKHLRKPDARSVQLGVGHYEVPELERRTVADFRISCVPLEQCPRVRCGKRGLTRRRSECHPSVDLR